MSNWKEILDEFDDTILSCTRTGEEMSVEFDSGYGDTEGVSFTAWSEKRVYFPVCYDGSEWIGSVSRNPEQEHTSHVGSG